MATWLPIIAGLTGVFPLPLCQPLEKGLRSLNPKTRSRSSLRCPGPGFLWKRRSGGRARAETVGLVPSGLLRSPRDSWSCPHRAEPGYRSVKATGLFYTGLPRARIHLFVHSTSLFFITLPYGGYQEDTPWVWPVEGTYLKAFCASLSNPHSALQGMVILL